MPKHRTSAAVLAGALLFGGCGPTEYQRLSEIHYDGVAWVITIGTLSGPYTSQVSAAQSRGVRQAIQEINLAGGMDDGARRNLRLSLDELDDQGDQSVAEVTLQREIAVKHPVVVFGPNVASAISGGIRSCWLAGVPELVMGTGEPDLGAIAGLPPGADSRVLRMSARNDDQAALMAEYTSRLYLRPAIVAELGRDGANGAAWLRDELQKRDLAPVSTGFFQPGETNFGPVVAAIRGAGADVVLVWTESASAASLAQELHRAAPQVPIVGSAGLSLAAFRRDVPAASVSGSVYLEQAYGWDTRPEMQAFQDRVNKRFIDPKTRRSLDPQIHPAWELLAYDGMRMVASAVKAAGATDGNLVASRMTNQTFHGLAHTYRIGAGDHDAIHLNNLRLVRLSGKDEQVIDLPTVRPAHKPADNSRSGPAKSWWQQVRDRVSELFRAAATRLRHALDGVGDWLRGVVRTTFGR